MTLQIATDYTFDIMIDTKGFTHKPTVEDAKGINYRIKSAFATVTVEELAQAVEEGKTFVPCKFKKVNGEFKRSIKNWHSQSVVALDFDEGLTLDAALNDDFFRSNAAFLYTTFSHTEEKNKFRVVFILDELLMNYEDFKILIDVLMNRFPQADKACKDGSRLFYGGREVKWFNAENRLNAQQCIQESLGWDIKNNNYISHFKPTPISKCSKTTTRVVTTTNESNIKQIRNKEIVILKSKLSQEVVSIKHTEVESYLNQLYLPEYLGVQNQNYNSFHDIFHDEEKPSASIFKSNIGNKDWLYKCFSSNYEFIGTIIDVTMKLQNVTRAEAVGFLCAIYNIEVVDAEVIEQHKRGYYEYLNLLADNQFQEAYPSIYQVLKRNHSLGVLIQLLGFVSEHVSEVKGVVQTTSFHSIYTLASNINISSSSMGRKINLFSFFGFVNKLSDEEINEDLIKNLNKAKLKNGYKKRSSVYVYPILSQEDLEEIDSLALKWLEEGMSIKTMTYEGIYRTFGKEYAERCFPQDKGKVIEEFKVENIMELQQVAISQIQERGWTTKKDIVEAAKFKIGNSTVNKKEVLDATLKELLDGYDFEFINLTKAIKVEMNITVEDMPLRSFPKIIRQRKG